MGLGGGKIVFDMLDGLHQGHGDSTPPVHFDFDSHLCGHKPWHHISRIEDSKLVAVASYRRIKCLPKRLPSLLGLQLATLSGA